MVKRNYCSGERQPLLVVRRKLWLRETITIRKPGGGLDSDHNTTLADTLVYYQRQLKHVWYFPLSIINDNVHLVYAFRAYLVQQINLSSDLFINGADIFITKGTWRRMGG